MKILIIKNDIIKNIEDNIEDPNYDLINFNLNKYFKCVFIKDENFKGKIIFDKDDMIIPKDYKKSKTTKK